LELFFFSTPIKTINFKLGYLIVTIKSLIKPHKK